MSTSISWASQPAWNISGIAADDLSPTTNIGTWKEWLLRIDSNPIPQPTVMTIPAGLPVTDCMGGQVNFASGGNLAISCTPILLQAASTFTAGTVDLNRATPAPTTIVDAATASFAAFLGKRIRITATVTPGKLGATAFILRAPAANTANTTPLMVANANLLAVTTFAPIVGDSYVIEDLPVINVSDLIVASTSNTILVGAPTLAPSFAIRDAHLTGFGLNRAVFRARNVIRAPVISASIIDGIAFVGNHTPSAFSQAAYGSLFQSATFGNPSIFDGSIAVFACGMRPNVTTNPVITFGGGFAVLDFDTYSEGGALANIQGGANVLIGTACCFRAPADAVNVQPGSICTSQLGNSGTILLYGNANVGAGVHAQSGAGFFYTTLPTITGASDTSICGVATAWAVINGAGGVASATKNGCIAPLA